MTEQIKEKNKGGRPRKEKKGKLIWVPDFAVDIVEAVLNVTKQQAQNQQATQ
jgi:hypothetical protein